MKSSTILTLTVCVILTCILFFYIDYKEKHPTHYNKTEYLCIVTSVEFHPMQSISMAQLDPIWSAKTNRGFSFSSRFEVKVGDTIKLIKLKKIEDGK